MNVILYGAQFRHNENGRCVMAGVAFRLCFTAEGQSMSKDFVTTSKDRNYGDLWLSELLALVSKMGEAEDVSSIRLITAQPELERMAKKVERILIAALEKDVKAEADIAHLVFKDGRYTPRPNNDLYTKLVLALLQLSRRHIHFSHENKPCVHTMELVKHLHQQIAPQKQLVEKKAKKTGAKKRPPVIENKRDV
ncbi:MAG: hypothetical protein ABTQ25_00030 [Nitrosomonas ureae]